MADQNENENEALGPCEFRMTVDDDGSLRCGIAASLSGLQVLKCVVGEDACRHCLKQDGKPNSVVASMAIRAANEHLAKDDAARVYQSVRHFIPTSPIKMKRVTAADLPCVHRGEKLREIDCEICGAKGEPVEVYECNSPQAIHKECTPGRWTTAPKEPSLTCLTCPHRTEPIQIELGGLSNQEKGADSARDPNPFPLVGQSPAKPPCKLTIGMATYDDEPGVFMTVESLRLYHADVLRKTNAEILIVDSNPGSKHGKAVRELCEHWGGGILRYVPADFAKGTSAPRDLVFREARGEIVLCIDCHVMLATGALQALVDHFEANPESTDLIQGPMLHHGCEVYATHMRREWGSDGMLGKWDLDDRIIENDPFEIEGHGMGLFACRKLAWRGFNPAFQGFGGEEIQYHDKVRAAGGKCLCLPELQWLHKFSRVDGVPYPLRLEDRFRNYLIGHMELGQDITPVLQVFAGRVSQEAFGRIVAEAVGVFS